MCTLSNGYAWSATGNNQLSPRTIFERILSSDAERTSRQEHFENDDSSYEEVTFGELIVSSDGLVEQKEVPKSHMEALKKDISDMRRANLRLEKTVEELKIQVEGLRNLNMKLLAADTRNQKFKSRIVDLLNELWRKIQQLESNGDNDKENQKMKPIECSKKSSSLANGQDFLDVLIGQINECENEVKQTLGHMNTFRDLIDQTGNVPSWSWQVIAVYV